MNCNETIDDQRADEALKARLDRIGHIFIVLSGKGGVGKSTVAVNLALSLSLQGMRTGILDVDIHGPSIPKLLGLSGKKVSISNEEIVPIEVYGNLKAISMGFFLDGNEIPVIWRGPMKAKIIREFVQNVAWGDLDYLWLFILAFAAFIHVHSTYSLSMQYDNTGFKTEFFLFIRGFKLF